MQRDSTFISKIFSDTGNIIEFFSLLVAIISLVTFVIPSIHRWWQSYRNRRSLRQRLGAELYTKEQILSATEYYTKPSCQDVDPTQEEEIRLVHGVQADLFGTIDKQLANPMKYKLMIVLADSGMGKTSFVLNYYARHWRSGRRRRKFNLALVPLGIPEADTFIKNIPNQADTVLFLDAFDEDTRAIQDYRQRMDQLLKLCINFRQILITSRTQFFRHEEEIPREVTGIVKMAVVDAGESRRYQFYKLYLSPFSDDQVDRYLKRRFPFWRRNQRHKAKELVNKVPLLTVRPMLLAHIKDLVQSGKSFEYSFQIYEEMVEAWLEREEPFVGDKAELRKFSVQLAIDLYVNAKTRDAERIHFSELEPMAKKFHIKLQDWQLRCRSLLNRDAVGNYKFAHRSIMEYLFVKRLLELKPKQRPKIDLTEQMKNFLFEIVCWNVQISRKLPDLDQIALDDSDYSKLKKLMSPKPVPAIRLRSKAKILGESEVKMMLKKYDLFDASWNTDGKGCQHQYLESGAKDKIISDLATGLIWQQGGSSKAMDINEAKHWIKKIKDESYAGFEDWRLPTLEEAMSLMEPKTNNSGLHIDPIFTSKQRYIWTGDQEQDAVKQWYVDFTDGYCYTRQFKDRNYVRVVRSGQSH